MPAKLPLPPEALGPLSLRQAAASGDSRAQYAIALRYAQGQNTAQDLTEAAHWLERAASAGLAPAQYRLAFHV
jgi:localization factor PodJL